MIRMIYLALIGVISISMLAACKREGVVWAGNEVSGQSVIYQPRQAPPPDSPEAIRQRAKNDHTVIGQLIKVDLANNTITILTEKGMEQTFKLDNTTMVNGSSNSGSIAKPSSKGTRIKELSGQEGETIIIEWEDHSGPKLAMSVGIGEFAILHQRQLLLPLIAIQVLSTRNSSSHMWYGMVFKEIPIPPGIPL